MRASRRSRRRGFALGADRARVREKLLGDRPLCGGPRRLDRFPPLVGDERFVTGQELLDLHRVIGERFGRRVDRGQPAADDDHRQPKLHVRDRIGLRRAGELQRHQEVGRRAHAGRKPVRQFEHRGLAGAGGHRDVVESQLERAVGVDRAAEAHAAEHRETVATLEQQADHLEKALVPAHGDPVLGDATESRHHAIVERLLEHREVADRLERLALAGRRHTRKRRVERLDLETVDADDRVAVVQQVMRERESCRSHPDDERALAGRADAATGDAD